MLLRLRNSERQTGHQPVRKKTNAGLPSILSSVAVISLPSASLSVNSGARLPTLVPTSACGAGVAVGSGVGVSVGTGVGVEVGAGVGVFVGCGVEVAVGAGVGVSVGRGVGVAVGAGVGVSVGCGTGVAVLSLGAPGRVSQAIPSPSLSNPCRSVPGPPAALKNACASDQVSKFEQFRSGPAGSYFNPDVLGVGVSVGSGVGVSVGAGTGVAVGAGTGVSVGSGTGVDVGALVGTAAATWAGWVGAGAGADTGAVRVSARSLSTLAHSSTSPPPNPAR